MNICGSKVRRAMNDLGLSAPSVLAVHDDLERSLGKVSYKGKGSAKYVIVICRQSLLLVMN